RIEPLQFALEKLGVDAAMCAVNRMQTGSAGEIFRRAAFILDHMRLAVYQRNAAGTVNAGKRQRVGGGAGSDKEYGNFTLEQFVEPLLDALVDFTCAIGCRKTRSMQGKALGDFRMGTCPVV